MNTKISKMQGSDLLMLETEDKINELIGMVNEHTDKLNEIVLKLNELTKKVKK